MHFETPRSPIGRFGFDLQAEEDPLSGMVNYPQAICDFYVPDLQVESCSLTRILMRKNRNVSARLTVKEIDFKVLLVCLRSK